MWECLRPEVRHCYLTDTGVADRYGIHTRMVAGALVVDNIVNGHTTMLMVNGVSGSVYAYNFGTNLQANSGGFQVQGILTHGGTPNMNLFEGNYSPQFGLDNQWNNSAYMLSFRNRHTAVTGPGVPIGNIQAVAAMEHNRHVSVIGCVLGTTGKQDIYEVSGDSPGDSNSYDGRRIYYLGFRAGGDGNGSVYDPLVKSTLIRAANWDSATNGIVGGGYTVADLPNSYFLTGKPTWFGNLAWPAFDPANPNLGPDAIPAGYRYNHGIDPPAAVGVPAAPTNLQRIPQ
jgi:hypothetical protein